MSQELGTIEEMPGKAYMEEPDAVSFTVHLEIGDRKLEMKWKVERAENYIRDSDRNFIFENIKIKKVITPRNKLKKHINSLMKEIHFYWRNRNSDFMSQITCRPYKAVKIFMERPENAEVVRAYDTADKYGI